jgi:protein-disulfide isomerase
MPLSRPPRGASSRDQVADPSAEASSGVMHTTHVEGEPKGPWADLARALQLDNCLLLTEGRARIDLRMSSGSPAMAAAIDVEGIDPARSIVVLARRAGTMTVIAAPELDDALRSAMPQMSIGSEPPRIVLAGEGEPLDREVREMLQLDERMPTISLERFTRSCLKAGVRRLVAPEGAPATAVLSVWIGAEPEPDTDVELFDRLASADQQRPLRGPIDAPVTLTAYLDLQSPYSAKLLGTLDELFERYPGKLRLRVRYKIGPADSLAAEAVRAAEEQGKSFEMQDLLFANMEARGRADLIGHARALGLDLARFTRALDEGSFRDAVAHESADAQALGVVATPTMFVNHERLRGALPLDAYTTLIDAALEEWATRPR